MLIFQKIELLCRETQSMYASRSIWSLCCMGREHILFFWGEGLADEAGPSTTVDEEFNVELDDLLRSDN